MTLDSRGHVFVAGSSWGDWGPGAAGYHEGGADAFLAELDGAGNLLANAFRGASDDDHGEGVAVDDAGRIFVAGSSLVTWGEPLRPHSGGSDAFVARLESVR